MKMLKRQFGYSIFKRYASVKTSVKSNIDEDTLPKSKSHVFKKKLFITHAEMADNLSKNCIYNEDGLIILNKPYGLKKEGKEEYRNNLQIARHPSVSNIHHLSFAEVLTPLSENLSVDQLNLVKLPDRYISGVSIATSKEIATRRIANCLKNPKLKPYTFLALCIGVPAVEEDTIKIGVTFKTKNDMKKVVFVEKYSTSASKANKVFPLFMHHKILSVNEELKVSLVQLTVNRNKWNCLRLYCATKLFAPCLGDWLMGSRVRYINEIPVLVDAFNPVTNSGPILSDKILNALQIKKHDQSSVPLHMHLSRVDLPRYGRDGKIFIAEPSEHLQWSCQQLGVSIPEYYLKNSFSSFGEPDDET